VSTRRVLITQPYVTHYRAPFFRRLAADLAAHGAELTVVHGAPSSAQMARGDTACLETAVQVRQRVLRICRRTLIWRDLRELASRAHVVVLEQALRNLETYPLLLAPRSSPAVALWGHGQTYNASANGPARAAKLHLTRQADWFFAYTRGGADHLEASGFPHDRITVVHNATDTTALKRARAAVTTGQIEEFAARHGLAPERTALFLGHLDVPKRIPFLLDAVRHVAARLPDFKLLIAGDGQHRGLVEAEAAARRNIVYLGPVFDQQRALLGASSQLMLMPGLVGLCAVDSFALGTPLVTTHWPFHSPEFEYLEHGRNSLVVSGGPREYADCVVHALTHPGLLPQLRQGCAADADRYTIERMSRSFAEGVLQLCTR
jgi:glycosyltransferase involved in cell wall biosynthesis